MKQWPLFLLLLPSISFSYGFPWVDHGPGTFTSGTTTYFMIGDTEGMEQTSATESDEQIPIRTPVILSKMLINVVSNGTTGTSHFRLRQNGSNANEVITIGAGQTGWLQDTVNADFTGSGNLWDYQLVNGSGGSITIWAIQILPSDSVMLWVAGGQPATQTNGFPTFYGTISGTLALSAQTETPGTQLRMLGPGTLQYMSVNVTSNTFNVNQTLNLRQNGTSPGIAITVSSNTTGILEDTVDTVHLSSGDLIDFAYFMGNTGNSGTLSLRHEKIEFVPDNMNAMPMLSQNMGHSPGLGSQQNAPLSGALGWSGTGASYSIVAMASGTISNLEDHYSSNAQAIGDTITSILDGNIGNQSFVVPASSTGYFDDLTRSDTFLSTDTLGSSINTAASGAIGVDYTQALFTLQQRGPSDSLPNGFQDFPSNNIWNTRIDGAPISANNVLWSTNTQFGAGLTPAFGTQFGNSWNGIPYNIICLGVTPNNPVSWAAGAYTTQSATLPVSGLPIPNDALMQGDPGIQNAGADNHIVLVDTCSNTGYDIFMGSRVFVNQSVVTSSWTIMQLTTWTYTSNALWPDTWTTANAAGMAILPELVSWDEVNAGAINHAVGVTLPFTHGPHIWPARHDANTGGTSDPPFGARIRLKANVNISGYSTTNQVILTALKKYGMFLVDNGPYWQILGAPNSNWNDSDLHNIRNIIASTTTLEWVDESSYMVDPNSGQAQIPGTSTIYKSLSGNSKLKGNGVLK